MKSVPASAVLAVVLLLAPGALAADPQPFAWSPYVAPQSVLAVALAKEGDTIGVGLTSNRPSPPDPSGGVPNPGAPRVGITDLLVFDVDGGRVHDGANYAVEGRPLVAVSRDGTTVASVGNDAQVNAPDPNAPTRPRLQYMRVEEGDFTRRAFWANVTLEGAPVALVLSEDGRRVAVASTVGTSLSIRGFHLAPGALGAIFDYRVEGNVTGLAADGALARLFAATHLPRAEGGTVGVLISIPFERGTPSSSWSDMPNATFTHLAASRDGGRVALAVHDGRVLLFRGDRPLADPATLPLGATPHALAVSEDGRRVAVHAGANLTHLDPEAPAVLWNASLARPSHSLAYNRTGGLLLAAVPGDALYAFGDGTPDVLWRNPGDARAVSLSSDGERFAFARGAVLYGFRLPRGIELEHAAGGDVAPVRLLRPGSPGLVELSVRNNGTMPETIRLEAPSSQEGLRLSFQPDTLHLRPGEDRRVNLTVEPAADLAGTRVFNVTARSLTAPLRDDATVRVALQPVANVSLVVDAPDVVASRDEPTTVRVGVLNRGTKDAAVGVRVQHRAGVGAPWDVVVDPLSFTLAGGSLTTVRITATPPPDVANGTTLTLNLTLEGPDVSDSAVLRLSINPSLGIEVGATPRIKFVQPGKAAHYNVTVKNTGSLPRAFEAFYDVLPVEGSQRAWAVDMSTAEFRLEPGATRTIPVRIVAPSDVTAADRVSVRVTARLIPLNDTEERVAGNVTLFANGEAPPPERDGGADNPVPSPALPVVAALVALAALLRRRRT